jgi:hypothetical protein
MNAVLIISIVVKKTDNNILDIRNTSMNTLCGQYAELLSVKKVAYPI